MCQRAPCDECHILAPHAQRVRPRYQLLVALVAVHPACALALALALVLALALALARAANGRRVVRPVIGALPRQERAPAEGRLERESLKRKGTE